MNQPSKFYTQKQAITHGKRRGINYVDDIASESAQGILHS